MAVNPTGYSCTTYLIIIKVGVRSISPPNFKKINKNTSLYYSQKIYSVDILTMQPIFIDAGDITNCNYQNKYDIELKLVKHIPKKP